jgi:predicted Zn finger-like uncharacterized protein
MLESESIRITCPQCGTKLRIKATQAGKKVKCPKCGKSVTAAGPPTVAEKQGLARQDAVPVPVFRPGSHTNERIVRMQTSRRLVLEGQRSVEHLAISPDGQFVAASTGVWRLPGGEALGILSGHPYYELSCLAISANSRLLFAAGHDEKPATMRLWSLPDGKLLKEWEGPPNYTRCAVFTPDGSLLITGTYPWSSSDHFIRFWSMPDGTLVKTLKGHAALVKHLAITPDGRHLVSGDDQGVVRIWSVPCGEMLARCRSDENNGVGCLVISADGRVAADGTHSKVRLWSVPDGALLKVLEFHAFWIKKLAASPDGRLLAACGASSKVRVWGLPDGRQVTDLEGHRADLACVAISADGRFLASGGKDQDVLLWSLPDGCRLAALEDHPGHVESVAIAPDGRTVAVGSEDGSVTLWDVAAEGEARPQQLAPAKQMPAAGRSCLALFVFNSDAISSAVSSSYARYAQGQVLKALAAAGKGGWSAYPNVMQCADGDLFEKSMMGETPALTVLHQWIARNQHKIDVGRLDAAFLGRLKSQTPPGFIPYALAIGPMPANLAADAHDVLHQARATGYAGLLTLDGAKDVSSLDAELHIPQHIMITNGRVSGTQASAEDIRQAGLNLPASSPVPATAPPPPRAQAAAAPAAKAKSNEHYLFKCRDCGFAHHVPRDTSQGPVSFAVDPDRVKITCVYGTFVVSLEAKDFFTMGAVPASGRVLEASIGPNMRALHDHILSHCDPLFLIIQQSPTETRHEYKKQPQGSSYVKFSKKHGVDIVGNIDVSKAEIPGVS